MWGNSESILGFQTYFLYLGLETCDHGEYSPLIQLLLPPQGERSLSLLQIYLHLVLKILSFKYLVTNWFPSSGSFILLSSSLTPCSALPVNCHLAPSTACITLWSFSNSVVFLQEEKTLFLAASGMTYNSWHTQSLGSISNLFRSGFLLFFKFGLFFFDIGLLYPFLVPKATLTLLPMAVG